MLLSLLGVLSYGILSLLVSFFIITIVSYTSNVLLGRILKLPVNPESSSITALILFCILPPVTSLSEAGIIALVAFFAMASKYLFVFRKKHVFNPAAFGAVVMPLIFGLGATWWVGSLAMLPVVAVVGFLIARKIHRFALVLSFIAAAVLSIGFTSFNAGLIVITPAGIGQLLLEIVTSWPIFFFGTIMLTEPLTTPATKKLQIIYGVIVGFLFGSSFHVGPFYATPEFALIIGNLFTVLVTPAPRIFLRFKEKVQLTPDTYHFSFELEKPFAFTPGQYMEWTLPHENSDKRGIRRYFTIASVPTEQMMSIGVKIAENSSSFKKALLTLTPGSRMVASQLAGDFTLPKESQKKLVFIAGGIGITPFRSMIQNLVATSEKRDIALMYAANTEKDFAYTDLWKQAESIGLRTHYFPGTRITPEYLAQNISDYKERTFYISGPGAMVHAYKELLSKAGVGQASIVTDYFPGF